MAVNSNLMDRNLADKLVDMLELKFESATVRADFVTHLAKNIKERFGNPIAPEPGESLAVSLMTPKTAALAFDRVYRIPVHVEPMPSSVGFYGATVPEIVWWAGGLLALTAEELDIPALRIGSGSGSAEAERTNLRLLCSDFPRVFGAAPTIFYHASGSQSRDFPKGAREVLAAAIHNIALVNETDLSWEQVLEFRRDHQARVKYRRLVRWIDAELATQSPATVEDLIAVRLDDYEWALRKHGIRTTIGALSCLLDPKFLAATSAITVATSVAGAGPWAALCAAALVVGRSALSFGTAYIDGLDERRKENYELAYLHKISREFG